MWFFGGLQLCPLFRRLSTGGTQSGKDNVMGFHQKIIAAYDLAAQVALIGHVHIEHPIAAAAFQMIVGLGVEIETVCPVRNGNMQNLALL